MSLQQLEGLLDVTFTTGKVAVLAVAGLNPGGGHRGQQSVKSTKALLESVVPRWVERGQAR